MIYLIKYRKNIPDGMRDEVFAETRVVNEIGEELSTLYSRRAYGEVSTPAVEYYDVFDIANGTIPEENMYKLTDKKGRLIVFRPDNTTPIARIVSTRLKNHPLPLKLFYRQNVFRIASDHSGKRSEFTQTGVEIIGGDMLKSDLECLLAALHSMDIISAYFGEKIKYKLEIGHVGFYRAIIDALGLSSDESEDIRRFVEQRNYSEIDITLSADSSDEKKNALNAIKQLPRLFGGAEVFEKARALSCGLDKANQSLDYLEKLYSTLVDAGYENRISVDLATANKIEYYTGFVFRAYLEYAGEPVLSGGRYDTLLDNFDMYAPATGFGVNLSIISDAAKKIIPYPENYGKPCAVIHYANEALMKAERYINSYPELCELSCCEALEDTIEYARKRGIGKVVTIDNCGFVKEVKLV